MLKTSTIEEESHVEKAFAVYRDTVLPPTDILIKILDQIPENQEGLKTVVPIRSPYTRIMATQFVTLLVLMIIVFPTYKTMTGTKITNIQFKILDEQIASYEAGIEEEDIANLTKNYN